MNLNKIKFKKTKEQKGITLVALAITIVILIILAAVTINMAFGDNGLIRQAELARDLSANSTVAEGEEMNSLLDEFGNIIGEEGSGTGGDEGGGDTGDDSTVEDLQNTINDLTQQIEELESKQATGTATEEQVLEGYTFSNSNGVGLDGSMPNRGTLNFNPSSSTTKTLEPGYYSGGTLSTANAYNAGRNSLGGYRTNASIPSSHFIAVLTASASANTGHIGDASTIVITNATKRNAGSYITYSNYVSSGSNTTVRSFGGAFWVECTASSAQIGSTLSARINYTYRSNSSNQTGTLGMNVNMIIPLS